VKQKEQLGETFISMLDYSFSENGLIAYRGAELIHSRSLVDYLGNEKIKAFVNFALRYIADLDIPVKRGTFIEFRTGMINVCPVGRNCSQQERNDFERYDKQFKIREILVKDFSAKFNPSTGYDLKFSIGGQISVDVFPAGWDKTYCLQHLAAHNFKEIHFFGDKTDPGGNDHEIFSSPKVIGHTVKDPADTLAQLAQIWGV